MRREERNKKVLWTQEGLTIILYKGEEGHDPHVHFIRKGTSWRKYLRDDSEERKTGDFNAKQKRKIRRAFKDCKASAVDSWNNWYKKNKV